MWLDPARTSPYQLHQFFLRSEDAMVGAYLRYFTFLSHEELAALDEATAAHPERREAHRVLAREVCTLVHGADETGPGRAGRRRAVRWRGGRPRRAHAARRVRRRPLDRPAAAPGSTAGARCWSTCWPRRAWSRSKSQARTTVAQGGAYVNNAARGRRDPPADRRRDLVAGRYVVLRRGKKDHHLVRFG